MSLDEPLPLSMLEEEEQKSWLRGTSHASSNYSDLFNQQPLTVSPEHLRVRDSRISDYIVASPAFLKTNPASPAASYASATTIAARSSPERQDAHLQRGESCSLSPPKYDDPRQQALNKIGRVRKRGKTTAENAQYFCSECGKPFQRNFNLRSHKQTHQPMRDKPFACNHYDCEKRFVRKTDLIRHEQSVRVTLAYSH